MKTLPTPPALSCPECGVRAEGYLDSLRPGIQQDGGIGRPSFCMACAALLTFAGNL